MSVCGLLVTTLFGAMIFYYLVSEHSVAYFIHTKASILVSHQGLSLKFMQAGGHFHYTIIH